MKPKDEGKLEEILSATLVLVKDYGLSGITMSMIAKKSGFATGTVYIYFQNKEELILKLFEKCMFNYSNEYFAGFDPDAPFKVAFRTIWSNMLRYSVSRFGEQIFIEQCFHSPFIPEETRKATKERFKPWRDLIDRGKKEKLIKDVDSLWLMIYVRGIIKELVKYAEYNDQQITQTMKDKMFEMCWDGIKD